MSRRPVVSHPSAVGAVPAPADGGPTTDRVLIEDIAARRRHEGIDDPDLEAEIRGLAVGDLVRLTLRAGHAAAGETVVVRVTAVGGHVSESPVAFRGALAGKPASKTLADLDSGFTLNFTADHIHSLPRREVGRH